MSRMRLVGSEDGKVNLFAQMSEERKKQFGKKVFELIMKERSANAPASATAL